MKKLLKFLTIVLIVSLSAFVFTACNGGSKETYVLKVKYYPETGSTLWGAPYRDYYITEGEPIEDINELSLPGLEFVGWDKEIPSVMPSENLTITAKYNVVTAPESIFIFEDGVITGLTSEGEDYYAIKIPSTIDGVAVTGIGRYAFGGTSSGLNAKIVEMPDSITTIGEQAFNPCSNLLEIKLSANITEIPYHCFHLAKFESIEIPSKVTKISAGAFNDCDKLSEIIIPESVQTISGSAFTGCDNISTISIHKSLKIETNYAVKAVFDGMLSLKEIKVDSENPYYTAKNGHLFSKDGNTLIRYAPASTGIEYNVSCEYIGDYAFRDAVYLETINLGAGVKEIGEGAFFKCKKLKTFGGEMGFSHYTEYLFDTLYYQPGNGLITHDFIALTPNSTTQNYVIRPGVTKIRRFAMQYNDNLLSVTIPSSVESIEYGAFYYCKNLSVLEYQGTVEEWKAVSKANGWQLSNSTNLKKVTCIDGDVNV